MAPRLKRWRLNPVSVVHCQVSFAVLTGAGVNQRFAKLTAVPPVAALRDKRSKVAGNSRPYNLVARIQIRQLRIALKASDYGARSRQLGRRSKSVIGT